MRGSAAEADLGDHLVLLQQSHVFQEQADHALALALRGGGVTPESRKIGNQGHHLLTLLRTERAALSIALPFVVFLGRGE
jgi:hypothetical protein